MTGEDFKWLVMLFGGLLINSILLTRWINLALHKLDTKIHEERQARTEYFDRKIEESKRLHTEGIAKYHILKQEMGEMELRWERKMNGYPTKSDIKDMLAPVASMVETIHEELVHRGIKSTAIHHDLRG